MKAKLLILALLLSLAVALPDPCDHNSDCRSLSTCKSSKCKHKDLYEPAPSEYIGFFVMFILCGLGASTGLGGGPLMTPIYILISFFDTYTAIPLAQLTIFTACLPTIFFRCQERNPHTNRPLIAWDLLILLQPCITSGALFGVMLNYTFPEWLILILLFFLLCYGVYSTVIKTKLSARRRKNNLTRRRKSPPRARADQDNPSRRRS
jgi:uncharacterized membrane protein YfcA